VFFTVRLLCAILAAVIGIALGMGGRMLLTPWLGEEAPFVLAFPAVAGVAYFAGRWAALLTAAGCVAWALTPGLPPSLGSEVETRAVALFLPSAFVVTLLAHAARAATAFPPGRALSPDVPAPAVIRWLKAVVAIALLLPTVFFAVTAWTSYRDAMVETQTRVDRAARIAREHAARVIETNEEITRHILDLLGTDDDAAVRARERALHDRLRDLTASLPQIHSVWVWDRSGRPLVSNLAFPVPSWLDISDREYFRWHQAGGGGWYVSESLVSRVRGDPFFDITHARHGPDGEFLGVVSVSLRPDYFRDFYAELASAERGLIVTLVRGDGALIARFPAVTEPGQRLPATTSLVPRMAAGETVGAGRAASPIDGQDRLIAFRKLDRYPLYVLAGIDVAVVLDNWYREVALLAALTFPTALGLLFVSWIALHRVRHELAAIAALRTESESRGRAERALRQAQKLEAMGQLTGGVAHDFNNLLMVVGNNVHLLKRLRPELDNDQRLAAIARAVGSGEKLTRQLLAFSRRQALRPEVLRLQDVLPTRRDLIKPAVGSRVQIATEIEPDTAPIEVDPAELELAVLNLALNARDAMPAGGRLVVAARNARAGELPSHQATPFVVLSVSDTGDGIAPELQERVFEPFFTTKPVGAGTGLGLSQMYGMCNQAGGSARIESAPGAGTTVRLYFPATSRQLEPPSAIHGAAQERLDCRVLLVEDNLEVAGVTADLLRSFGCKVEHVASGDAALARLAGGRDFDVMLSDIVMPGGIDGLALASRVRKLYPALAVVLMTGHSEHARRMENIDFDVLQKPFSPPTLLTALARACAPRAPAHPA
jgi:signal transduction histidine kinase/CheY-like chemotaxis protein